MDTQSPAIPPLELWAGIECTVNRVGDNYFDQLERSGHAVRLKDLERLAELGIRKLRYPVLWERTAPRGVDDLQWAWADERLNRLQRLRMQPIVGFLHHGSGPHYTGLLDPLFPEKLAKFAEAFAREWSAKAEHLLSAEWQEAIRRDYNHPCIIAWVPVNESMGFPGLTEQHAGQYAFIERMVKVTRHLDSSRPVIDNDGWEHTDITDICAIHDYTPTSERLLARYQDMLSSGRLPLNVWLSDKPLFARGSTYRGQPIVLSEVGGFLSIPQDIPAEKRDMLYQFYDSFQTQDQLLEKYRDLMAGIASLTFLAGFCYTQLTDIEQEINGLLTYDRQPKLPVEIIGELHRELS